METPNDIILLKLEKKLMNFELVERKGIGHPDTLADSLADQFSRVYSRYTLEKFGAILHHNFDKVGILGGRSYVTFGKGYLTSPIRVLINGRASTKFGNKTIPVRKLLENTARSFFVDHFPNINPENDIEIHYNLSTASSPGKVDTVDGKRKFWFKPRSLKDLPENSRLFANDTSIACSYAPLSITERLVLELERFLNSPKYKENHPWLGTDIKIDAYRINNEIGLTICLPQIADYVPNIQSYKKNLEETKKDIRGFVKQFAPELEFHLYANTRDDFNTPELYLTSIGSSLGSGDEGLVGRGNRVNGLITPTRPMSIEGASGKNPVYHVGKIYNIACWQLAQKLYGSTGGEVEVYLLSQSGRDLKGPWKIIVALENNPDNRSTVGLIRDYMERIPEITHSFIKGEIDLFY
jgi:S-adenosylmethionine synthetase